MSEYDSWKLDEGINYPSAQEQIEEIYRREQKVEQLIIDLEDDVYADDDGNLREFISSDDFENSPEFRGIKRGSERCKILLKRIAERIYEDQHQYA